jgi:HSP20 family molecular chaperone IbpA
MTDDRSDPDEDDDSDGVPPFLGGLLGDLDELVDLLAELDQEGSKRDRGRVDRGDATIDYEFSVDVGIGPDDGNDDGERRRTIDADDLVGGDEAAGEADETTDGDEPYRVRVDERDEELVITADLPSVSEDEVDVELDADTQELCIRADGEALERVTLDRDDAAITAVSFTNHVLEIRVSVRDDERHTDHD